MFNLGLRREIHILVFIKYIVSSHTAATSVIFVYFPYSRYSYLLPVFGEIKRRPLIYRIWTSFGYTLTFLFILMLGTFWDEDECLKSIAELSLSYFSKFRWHFAIPSRADRLKPRRWSTQRPRVALNHSRRSLESFLREWPYNTNVHSLRDNEYMSRF